MAAKDKKSVIRSLIENGKANGKLTTSEINDALESYSRRYPAICQQTDADPETGCMEFDIEKGRFSFRLTAPYSEERREAARRYARENSFADGLK